MLEVFNFYKYFFYEDFIVVLFLFSFFSHLFATLVVELIWPTQYFNRKHNIGFQLVRFRSFTEVLLKLRNYNSYYNVFYKFFFLTKIK